MENRSSFYAERYDVRHTVELMTVCGIFEYSNLKIVLVIIDIILDCILLLNDFFVVS
jgi:hypothetical protein